MERSSFSHIASGPPRRSIPGWPGLVGERLCPVRARVTSLLRPWPRSCEARPPCGRTTGVRVRYTTDFQGRTVLVTGASGGIGGETVRQLAAAGADVVAAGRSEEALNALVGETGSRPLPFDLTSEDSVRDALDGLDLYGVVNCGGYGGEIGSRPTVPVNEGGLLDHVGC